MIREAVPSRQGFTLIEVLVALAIIAIGLGAGLRAAAVAADNTLALRERTLARWIAENELTRYRVASGLPHIGEAEGEVEQARSVFVWKVSVESAPNPNFRRIVVRVRRQGTDAILAELHGFTIGRR